MKEADVGGGSLLAACTGRTRVRWKQRGYTEQTQETQC